MIRRMVAKMQKQKYVILVPILTVLLCWTLLTDATESEPGTLEYLELFSQCFELVQSRYLEETDPDILAEGAVEGMLLATSPYAALLPKTGQSGLIPAWGPATMGLVLGYREPMMQVIDLIPGSPAQEHGILPGDTVIRIGDQVTPYLTVDRAARMLTGNAGDKQTIFVQNHLTGELKEQDIEMKQAETSVPELEIVTVDDVRVIRLGGEPADSVPDRLFTELSGPGAGQPTILDLRHLNRGSEALGLRIADLFLADGLPMISLCRQDHVQLSEFLSGDGRSLTGFPLVVIIDGTSAGPAETCAQALKSAGRAVITGDPSFGRCIRRDIQPLDNAFDVLMVTGYYCAKNSVQTINEGGVIPDVPVVLPATGDVDPYMQTALSQIGKADEAA